MVLLPAARFAQLQFPEELEQRREMLRFLPLYTYNTKCDSYRTLGLMTHLCLPLVRIFLMAIAFYIRILTQP